ncbi:MAG: CoA transferase [Chloroflexi bacterium]|nr:CoA transferase [Chloroflexota bacterium]
MNGSLPNLRILDLTQGIAGPFCTKLLADYGAEVIKVEPPGQGDPSRRAGPFPGGAPHLERSGLFLHLNTNKLGITLDPATSAGAALCRELVHRADMVVESFHPGTLEALGLGYAALRQLQPALVLLSITDFGQTGPYRDYKGSELVLQALGGPMYSRGLPDREPLKYADNVGQMLAGLTAAVAALGAIFLARYGGIGQWVDVSIAEAILGSVERGATGYQYTGEIARRLGNQAAGTYLMGAYQCKDGYIGVQGGGRGESWWPRVYAMIGMPELAADPRFSTPEAREANRGELDALWYSWLLDHTREEVFAAGRAARYPLAPVNTPADLVSDAHNQARGFFVEMDHPEAGRLLYPGAPFRLSAVPWLARRPAPLLGQHNEEVYGGLLGLTREKLAALRQAEVV